jgi:type I restriction enzyme S subunit
MTINRYILSSEFCESVRDGTHDTPKQTNSGYRLVTSKHIKNGQINSDEGYFISEKDFKKINERSLVEQWDVLMSMIGTIGEAAIVKDQPKYAIKNVALFKCGDELKAKWLYYFLCSPEGKGQLFSNQKGASQQFVSLTQLRNLQIPIRDQSTMKKITDILSAYDYLIENNQKQIRLLEEAAMRLYKEWFVNLRFPGYENTKIIDGVPEGWEKCNLGLYAKVKSGYAFKSSWWKHNGVPVIKIKDIQDNTVNLSQLDCVDISNANKAIDFKVVAGDLLIAMTGATTGKIAIVPIADDMLVNQRVGKFFLGENPIAKLPFLYSTLQEANSHNWALNFANGSAQPNISPTQIESLEILFSERFVSLYNEKMQPYFESIIKLRRLINRAQQARDKLLPKLMSGEIEV